MHLEAVMADMKKLICGVLNWLIKRLGGYTEAEYWKALHPPLQDELVPIKRKNIVRITATMAISRAEVGYRGFPSEQFIRKKLQLELSQSIGDCMKVYQSEDKGFFSDSLIFEAQIDVIRGE